MTEPVRKWAMTRIRSGDYLLPSNDARTLWRISEYAEDGSAGNYDGAGRWVPITGRFWQVSKFKGPLPAVDATLPDDFLDWDNWETHTTGLLKRKYAVEVALNAPDTADV
jgi:hypothetical protein